MTDLRILGLSGSLRRGSYNTALLNAAVRLAPPSTTIDVYDDLAGLPMYNEDLDVTPGPPSVQRFRRRVSEADGLLIVTPEHNSAIPAALKNALDWASRPIDSPALAGKPVAVAGASPGMLGSSRAQLTLRQILTAIGCRVLAKPEVIVAGCHDRIGSDGALNDPFAAKLLGELVSGLTETIRPHAGSGKLAI